jgi:hypothetical protein
MSLSMVPPQLSRKSPRRPAPASARAMCLSFGGDNETVNSLLFGCARLSLASPHQRQATSENGHDILGEAR